MKNLKEARRLVLWAIELSEFDVQYRPRVVSKAQALADFVAELTTKDEAQGAVPWVVRTDRLSN